MWLWSFGWEGQEVRCCYLIGEDRGEHGHLVREGIVQRGTPGEASPILSP